jgi:hypothetical protein
MAEAGIHLEATLAVDRAVVRVAVVRVAVERSPGVVGGGVEDAESPGGYRRALRDQPDRLE